MKVSAQTQLGTIGGTGDELGPFGKAGANANPLGNILNLISSVVGFMTIAACIWFLFQILYSGYEWTSAGGDTKKIADARSRMTHAFMGMVIVVGAWSLLAVTGQFFGFNTLVDPNVVNQLLIP